MLDRLSKTMRALLLVVVLVASVAIYAVLDRPTDEEKALAQQVAPLIAKHFGSIPKNGAAPEGQASYTFRAARHGLVVFVSFGLVGASDKEKLRAAVQQTFREVPALHAVSLEAYELHEANGKARYLSKTLVSRGQ